MRSSNFCRNPRLADGCLFAALAVLCFSPLALAVDPNRTVSQYIRDHWGPDKGFPSGPVYAITQTTDGYLWIGTEAGLVRFDGLAFQLIQSARTSQLSLEQPLGQSLGVAADDSGSLWIRLRGPALLGYRSGSFFEPPQDLETARVGVTVASRGRNGRLIFVTRRNGLFVLSQGKLDKLAAPESMPASPVISLAETPDGDAWLGTRDGGLVRLRNGQSTSFTTGLPDLKINSLLPVADGLWIATDNGIVRWNGSAIVKDGIPPPLAHSKTLAMIQDHDVNIWIAAAQGLFRANPKGVSRLSAEPDSPVTALFEDREGNIWIGSANGIERLRDSVFATYSVSEGLPSENTGPVYADAESRTWFAPENGGLYSLSDGKIAPATGLEHDIVYSIAGNSDGLWIGRQRGGLTHLTSNGKSLTSKTYTATDGLAQNTVLAVSISRDGTVWAGTLNGGVSRFHDGRFTTFTSTSGLASNTVSSILESSGGAMWFATPTGLSSLRTNGGSSVWRTYTASDGLPSDNVNCLFEDSTGTLWIGTLGGLAFLRDGRIQLPTPAEAPLREQIFGIAEDRTQSLWIATANHVLRLNRNRLFAYELADGLRSLSGVKRHRSVIADPLGRIWLSTSRGLSVVDPARLASRAVPAVVRIQALSADDNSINLGGQVRIPPRSQRIVLDYSGLSLAIPERTRFRYTLEGFDHGWSQPVASREAVYTNLGPGPYRFRVMASNLDEVFDSQEASLAFQIEPAFWQTWWFLFAALLLLLTAVVASVRFRMRRLTRRMNLIFEERLAERTKIAQELHDTLLQGFLSASMQLHVAADRLPEDSPVKPSIDRVLALMARVIGEGRGALQGLRSPSADPLDLEHAFSTIQQELDLYQHVSFRVVVEGKLRPLHPVLRDEVYRIGREALVNAFRHSGASSIEVELEYASRQFRVLVRDNGCGIDPLVLQSGREGHWGLPGMRERAESIGARLRVWSRASSGTEVELSVPSHVAFKKK